MGSEVSTMHVQNLAIIKALVPVAWADGEFADREKQILEALLDVYKASDEEKASVRAYAAVQRRVEDIDVSELSSDDRRMVLQNAVIMSFADYNQSPEEVTVLHELARHLRLGEDEAKAILKSGAERARMMLSLL